jgi:hypothetical protein
MSPTPHHCAVVTIQRPVLFAVAVSLATLVFAVVGYFLVPVFVLGPIQFD